MEGWKWSKRSTSQQWAHGQVSSPASGERPKAAGYLACHRTRICMHHQCMENIYRHGVRFSLMTACDAFQILHYRQGGSLYIHSVRYAVAGGWCWFVMKEKYCWLAGGCCWFGMREKHCWLNAANRVIDCFLSFAVTSKYKCSYVATRESLFDLKQNIQIKLFQSLYA